MPGMGILGTTGVAIGATLLSKFLTAKTWTLFNTENNKRLEGQFPHEGLSREVGAHWEEINALTRERPILQFITGEVETLEMSSRFFRRDITDDTVNEKISTLISWTKKDPRFGRPPILQLMVGDGEAVNMRVILKSLSRVQYAKPDFQGQLRMVTFQMTLWNYTEFAITDQLQKDTRYHRTARGQYYELIAKQEYGNPLLGDVIRKSAAQSGKALLSPGDIVKLPSIEGIRSARITQTSVILKGAFGQKDTPQRKRREEIFDEKSQPVDIDINGDWTF
jgi:hypothetical protein